jgi:ATP/maltotriose-dependent transcriptional regulator MalT
VLNGLDSCATLCTATGRYAEATLGAALDAHPSRRARAEARRQKEAPTKDRQALGPAGTRAAEERGAAISLDAATEYARMLTEDSGPPHRRPQLLGQLSARERKLATLIAQGRTNARIAARMYISVRLSARTWTGSGTRPAAAAAPT